MSRRDTIIIAVLVNAALLMVLFITAIRSGKGDMPGVSEQLPMQLAEKTKDPVPQTQEDLLNQYITPMPTFAETCIAKESTEILPVEEIPFSFPVSEKNPLDEQIAAAPPLLEPVQPIKEETSAPAFVNVTVKKGDFLEKIAKANSSSVSAIMKANNLASTQLKIGQVLKIPLAGAKKTTEKQTNRPASVSPVSSETEYYTVKDGDNPWLIASRNHLKLEELLKLNQLDEQKAKKLRPGDKLRIR